VKWEYQPYCEALSIRLPGARRLNGPPAADVLTRLRVLEHCILSVNLVLRLKVVSVGGGPVAIKGRSAPAPFPPQLQPAGRCSRHRRRLGGSPNTWTPAARRPERHCWKREPLCWSAPLAEAARCARPRGPLFGIHGAGRLRHIAAETPPIGRQPWTEGRSACCRTNITRCCAASGAARRWAN
jgi:hypothetical protein